MSAAGTTTSPQSDPTAALRRDLAMVAPWLAQEATTAAPVGAPGFASADVTAVAAAIRQSRAPAIIGLNMLSIEAVRHAIALAEAIRGRLLPWPMAGDLVRNHPSVTLTGSLGHIFASQLIIWVGCTGGDGPIAEAIAAHQLLGAIVPADLATVLKVRKTMAADAAAAPIGKHDRVGVVLAPGLDPRVASQWHKLAAQVQATTRLSVLQLPDLATAGNRRGVLEAIAWQTGQSCASGGVDFGDGAPRPCGDAQTLLERGAIDLLIDTTPMGLPEGAQLAGRVADRIVLGPEAPPAEAGLRAERTRHVALPRLPRGDAARVMRFDGVILWTYVDPASARPDATAAFLAALLAAVRSQA